MLSGKFMEKQMKASTTIFTFQSNRGNRVSRYIRKGKHELVNENDIHFDLTGLPVLVKRKEYTRPTYHQS